MCIYTHIHTLHDIYVYFQTHYSVCIYIYEKKLVCAKKRICVHVCVCVCVCVCSWAWERNYIVIDSILFIYNQCMDEGKREKKCTWERKWEYGNVRYIMYVAYVCVRESITKLFKVLPKLFEIFLNAVK